MEGWPACTSSSLNDYANYDHQRLPPGFRFHPSDEELITYYLAKRLENANFSSRAVAEADLNKSEPWELPGKAQMGDKEWYFYSARDRKYPTGLRTNRATEAGYWKATGKDREVVSSAASSGGGGRLVGMKKTLVFYKGRAPKGLKTNWVMHEYRAEGAITAKTRGPSSHSKDEWVVCRIFHKNAGGKKMSLAELRQSNHLASGAPDVYATSLPALLDSPAPAPSHGGSSAAQLRSSEESLMLHTILQQHFNSPFAPLESNVKVEASAADKTPTPPCGALLSHYHPDMNASLLSSATTPPPPQFQYRIPSVTNTTASASVSPRPPSSADHHLANNYSSPPMISTAYLAPLPRFPSELESLWLYSDRL